MTSSGRIGKKLEVNVFAKGKPKPCLVPTEAWDTGGQSQSWGLPSSVSPSPSPFPLWGKWEPQHA